jgi:hypothetical protein
MGPSGGGKVKKLTAHFMILTALVVFAFAPAAFADIISGTAGDGFRTWGTTDLSSQSGFPYWNNVSGDLCSPSPCSGTHKDNIGFILTNTGNAGGTLSSPPGAIPFWGGSFTSGIAAGGAADPNFLFVKNSTGGAAVLKAEVTARTTNNAFGWFDIATPTVLHPIFGGATAVGTSASFAPSSNYGFYFTTCEAGSPSCTSLVVWETEGSHNHFLGSNTLVDTSDQHFAVFQETTTPGSEVYWLGMEDLRFGAPSDRDYNDMVVRIAYQGGFIPPTAVPEPSSMMLLGSGLLVVSIGIAVRRRVFNR